jgi:hypothetical protein
MTLGKPYSSWRKSHKRKKKLEISHKKHLIGREAKSRIIFDFSSKIGKQEENEVKYLKTWEEFPPPHTQT